MRPPENQPNKDEPPPYTVNTSGQSVNTSGNTVNTTGNTVNTTGNTKNNTANNINHLQPYHHAIYRQSPNRNSYSQPVPSYDPGISYVQQVPAPSNTGISFTQPAVVYDNTLSGINIQFERSSREIATVCQPHAISARHYDVRAALKASRNPVFVVCPYCQYQGFTETKFTPGLVTWGVCLGLAVFGCWLGCCLVPFCTKDFKDCKHICTNCNRVIYVNKMVS